MGIELRASRRGRPVASLARNVPDAILKATKECLCERSHIDLTLRDVAQRAGTSQEMINYYFGGRDGLLAKLSADMSDEIASGLAAIDASAFGDSLDFTTAIVRALLMPMGSGSNLAAIIVIETARPMSSVREHYVSDGKSRTCRRLEALVRAGVARNLYRAEVDPQRMSLSFMGLAISLPMLPSLSGGISLDNWIEHVGQLMNASLAANP